MKTRLRFWYGGSGPVLPLTIATISAGCASAPPVPQRVITPIVDCDAPPMPITVVLPPTSAEAHRHGGEGVVSILVDGRGIVREARIVTSSGWPPWDREVLRAVREARYRPYSPDCEPVEKWTTMRFSAGKGRTGAVRPG